MNRLIPCIAAGFTVLLASCAVQDGSEHPDRIQEDLMALERESHQRWLEGDLAALDALMAEDFRFVAMNGALETKGFILGTDQGAAGPERPLQVTRLFVEPEEVLLHGNTAFVISLLHIEATVRDRPVPDRMRILSAFIRADGEQNWLLSARSITPILSPPGPPGE